MWQTRTGASAMAVELAAALLLATAISDALGFAGASFYLLVAGVPLTAVAGLICFARVVDAVNEAAIREPSVGSGDVPPPATAVLAFGFALLVAQALIALVPLRRKRPKNVGADRPFLSLDG